MWEFSSKKTIKEAGLFYVFYVGVLILSVGLSLDIAKVVFKLDPSQFFIKVFHTFVSTSMVLVLSYLILAKKNLQKDLKSCLLVPFSVLITILFGIFIGLVPVAFLTTVDKK